MKKVCFAFALAAALNAAGAGIRFVNAGDAVPAPAFTAAVAEACAGQLGLRHRVESVAAVPNSLAEAAGDPAVYITSSAKLPPVAVVPGRFAVLNLRALFPEGKADAAQAKGRLVRTLRRGIGLLAGLGGNPDPHDVMYWKAFSPVGADLVPATYGPESYFILTDSLRRIAGEGVFAQPE